VQPLPIDPLLPEIVSQLTISPSLVLEAPPGAGKTTRVPRALLDQGTIRGEIVVLEPRRLAARMAARRVAEEMGQEPGKVVGYQVRFEDVTSAETRIRFVTEAILTRRLTKDPSLDRIGAVILDEFHERHLHTDVALAWLRHLQRTTRPDLKLIVMSATLDAEPAARFLDCRALRSEGRSFEVAIEHIPQPDDRHLDLQVASAVRTLLRENLEGDVLVFLPGARDIRRTQEALEKLASENALLVLPLHGDLTTAEQERAIRPQDRRKIILSTNVAESSVTIDGVVAVIDSGLARVPTHDPWSGLMRLDIEKISRASAIQRAGRAGRTRPGRAIRLYTKADFDRRPEHQPPEIARLDLTELLLELRAAGIDRDLTWLAPPPPQALASAEKLLERLGATDATGAVTSIGRRMLRFPVHPRQARLLVEAEARHVLDDAAVIAALLAERDIRRQNRARFDRKNVDLEPTERSDLLAMLDRFREAEDSRFSAHALRAIDLDPGATFAVDRARKQLARAGRSSASPEYGRNTDDDLLKCVLAGYPDRVARRLRPQGRAIALAGGGTAELTESSVVRDAEWLIAVDGEDRRPGSSGATLIRTASAIEPEWLIELFTDRIEEGTTITFVRASERVDASSRMTYDGLVLDESPAGAVDERAIAKVLADAALAKGLKAFTPDPDAFDAYLARARFAHTVDASIPLLDDAELRELMVMMCEGHRSFQELRDASLLDTLRAQLGSVHTARISALAPERITLPRGRSVKVHYEPGKTPHIESRLQDFFGMKETPRIGGGTVALVVHLLAPNQRAVQVTTDLSGFWSRHYPGIRKELARRYPRHAWPEDPQS
jgi:ATP-dependent helicase HrpB